MNPDQLLQLVQRALATGDYAGARDALLTWPHPAPDEIVCLIGELEIALGQPPLLHRAVARLRRLAESSAEDETRDKAQILLGAALSCLGDDPEAVVEFRKGFVARPEWLAEEYGAAFATSLVEVGDFAEADRIIAQLGEGDARRLARTRWSRRQHRPDEAWGHLSPTEGERDPGICFEAACICHARGDAVGARRWAARGRNINADWFDRAVEMEPEEFRPNC